MTGSSAHVLLSALSVLAGAAGCELNDSSSAAMTLTDSGTRAERRLYDGAPSVIPHPAFHIRCVSCHSSTGAVMPPTGYAPAHPHAATPGLSNDSDCRQCHVFRTQNLTFVDSEFVGIRPEFRRVNRADADAPPEIPHRVFMREDCSACHSGPAARPEIRCSHPQRIRCGQCHVAATQGIDPPDLE